MVENTFDSVMSEMKEAVRDPRTPSDVRKAVLRGIGHLEDLMEGPAEEEGEEGEEEDGCLDCGCSHQPDYRISQVIPAAGWQAVFAETDEKDPQAMAVEPVMFFALMEFEDGFSCLTGMYAQDDQILPCWPVGTFVGYVPPGKNPDMYAGKVSEKIKEIQAEKAQHEKT
jgi:hypothetical protein